jgi:glycosyltransferase involved in cell wall biosynthesis
MKRPENCPSVTVLVCTLNEEKNLPHVLPKIPRWVDEILIVDGHSTDNTFEVAKEIHPEVKVLYQPDRGKGDALRYGIQQASGEIIVTLDADGQTNPEEIERFINPLLNGYDFAKGTRLAQGRPPNMSRHRWFGNKILAITSNILYGTKYTDVCSGYNAFWKKSWVKIRFPDEFGYEPLIIIRVKKAGLKILEITSCDEGRVSGTSKLPSWRQGWGALKAILKERI